MSDSLWSIDCSLFHTVHGGLKERILKWFAISSSRGSSCPESNPRPPCLLHWQMGSLPLAPPGKPHAQCKIFPQSSQALSQDVCFYYLFHLQVFVLFLLFIEHCYKILAPFLGPQGVGEHYLITTDPSLPHQSDLDFLSPCFSPHKFLLTCAFLLYTY